MNQDLLRERTKNFINELNLPISRFAKTIGFERSTYYRWIKGHINFGEQKVKAIDEYIGRFGF